MHRRTLLPALLAIAMVFAAASGASAKNTDVDIRDSFYRKAFRVIQVGDSVTWEHKGNVEHTVTSFPSAPSSFGSTQASGCTDPPPLAPDPDDCMDPGDTFSATFDAPGRYAYYCKVHGTTAVAPEDDAGDQGQPCGMCGVIVVKTVSSKAPTSQPRPSSPPPGPPSPTPTVSATPSETAEPTADPSAEPTLDGTATGDLSGDGDGGDGGRIFAALLGIVALGGAGYWTWRRYLA